MNMIDRTFIDAAYYWPLVSDNPDGTKTFGAPVVITGRWNEERMVRVGATEERVMLGARFSSLYALQAKGWLILTRNVQPTVTVATVDPRTLRLAREIDTVSVTYPYDRATTYYTGVLK